jgi:hypothetical protein
MAAIAALTLARAAAAQDVQVRAVVDRQEIGENQELVLSVEVLGAGLGQATPPDMSRLEDFTVTGGPAVSQRFQWVNGQSSSARTYRYSLRPRKTGTLTIPPIGLLIQGRTYRTTPIDIEVVAGAPGGAPPGGVRPVPLAPPGGGPGHPRTAPPAAGAAPPILLRAEVDSRTAYVGQQITLRVVLDTQTEILNLGLKETPTFPGFWAEEIKVPENLEMKRVQRGDQLYNEYTLLKKALFPATEGRLTIPPLTWQIQVRRRSGDPIESFFFTPTETIARRTDPVVVEVRPLPAAGRPAGFSGAVGQFSLSVTADRKEAQVNDAVGLKVRVAGEGSLNAINAIDPGVENDFKRYEPRVTSSSLFRGDRLRSERTWDYVLIPLAPGDQAIPPVSFSWFDPQAGEYRTTTSAPIPIRVTRGTAGPGGEAAPAVAQSDVRAIRQDIRYIKQAPGGLRDRAGAPYRSPWFLAALVVPVAADLGLWALARRRDAARSGARQRRERRARSAARRRLKEARRRLGPSTSRAFYAEVARALTEYVADKFDVAAAGLTHEKIEELLAGRGVGGETRSAFHQCLELCDFARFAPASSTPDEMQRALARAEETIVAVERGIAS